VSRLTELLREVERKDARLAADLAREYKVLSERRAYGLNFERHVPETVDLPGRPVRRGDKVRFLPQRGARAGSVDERVWRVAAIESTDHGRVASLIRQVNLSGNPT
jgi:adenine-specific DNA-methyltransferase